MKTLHDFSIQKLDGSTLNFSDFKGKKVLIVNVASECGYTPQYAPLQELYENAQDNLVIVGCPCNDFGGQEPGSHEAIQHFCQVNYGVTFPITEKLGITQNTHPLYQWLTQKSKNGLKDSTVTWNFCKFLVDENGQLVDFYAQGVSPFDDAILKEVGLS